MLGEPADRGDAILEARRELVLRRQAIVDARDQEAARLGEPPADAVMGVEAADHPAAAVDVDQAGRRPRGARVVQADADRPARARDLVVVDRPEDRPVGVPEGFGRGAGLRPRLDWRERGALRPALHGFGDQGQNGGHLRVRLGHRDPSWLVGGVRLALPGRAARLQQASDVVESHASRRSGRAGA